ncbi:FAD-dependent urate hydroxylase [Gimesia panareensis]|uniref:FAD-dependent urate hydroxylase n=1 Tax=Gimesia panareensis TaxID=2527978 RepID=A0A518FQH7_9PLAN|nr:NAD(P)/FAD-dependent oxidoreductase [Gimesia panareensis]QDV18607.1 FAD-dependent urate hydroxylase [Gimesia panareensis]
MKIAIAGCGIAGTAAASLLAKQGHEVTLFEQAVHCGPVGAGILIQPIGQRVLQQLGIYDAIAKQSARLNAIEAIRESGKRLIRLEYQRLDPQHFGLGVHRGRLFAALLDLAKQAGAQIREGARVIRYQLEPTGVTLQLENGERSERFDFIIATDGSRSVLRTAAGIMQKGVEYEYGALWATGNCSAVRDHLLQMVSGTRKLVGMLPIGQGECSFFWGLTAAQFERYQQQGFDPWRQEVLKLCPQAEELINATHGFQDYTFTTYRSVSMRRWHAERIIFLGDAAHPTSPHLGQGANLALEDVWVFAECLQQSADFQAACHKYELLRKQKLRFYQRITAWLSPFFQSSGVIRGWGRDLCLPVMSQTPLLREQMLKTLCGFKTGWLHSRLPEQK